MATKKNVEETATVEETETVKETEVEVTPETLPSRMRARGMWYTFRNGKMIKPNTWFGIRADEAEAFARAGYEVESE